MDQNKSTIPLSMSDPRPISPSPDMENVVLALPAPLGSSTNSEKRKRGRPRKYDRDEEEARQSETPKRRSLRNHGGDMSMTRGWDLDMSMSPDGYDFTPLAFTVNKGEDIIERIMSFTENGSRGITVLSVEGTVANVMIRPVGGWYPCNAVMYKDAHEIMSLSCSMTTFVNEGVNTMTGRWQIMIAGADGTVIGGALADRLIAASPVQVVIGSFWLKVTNPPQKRNNESKDVVQPTVSDSLASSSIGPSQSQKSDGESEDVIVPPSVPSVLASEGRGHVQQPDESKDVVVPPTIPSVLASEGAGHVEQPDESEDMVVQPTIPNSLTSEGTEQVQKPGVIDLSESQKSDDESEDEVVPPSVPSVLAYEGTTHVKQPDEFEDMAVSPTIPSVLASEGTAHVKQPDESEDMAVSPTIPSVLASEGTGHVQEPDESEDVVVPPTISSVLASEGAGQDQQPDVIGPFQSQTIENESEPVIVPPTITSEQTETTCTSPALNLNLPSSNPELNK